jgi:DNA modification methylase
LESDRLAETLLLGDCLDILPTLVDASVDMVITDLPYGTTRNAWDSVIDLDRLWPELWRVTKPNAAIVMTAQSPFDKVLGMSQLTRFRYEWIWEKTSATGHLNARKMPMKAHENVLVFYRSLPTYNPQKTVGHERKVSTVEHKRNSHFSTNYGRYLNKGYDATDRFPRSVIKFSTDKQKLAIHPTQKPVALFEYLIRTYTDEGQTVLDVAAGSGTTAIAARNTGRHSVVIEMDETYFGAMTDRLAA